MAVKTIPVSGKYFTLVDAEDYDYLIKFKWYACISHKQIRAKRRLPEVNGKTGQLLMHREIMKAPTGMDVDHINGDALDNRRLNLRLCTHAQNQKNMKTFVNNKSGLKGAFQIKGRTSFSSSIKVDGKKIRLGNFKTADDAHKAYCEAAKKYHGEFARFV